MKMIRLPVTLLKRGTRSKRSAYLPSRKETKAGRKQYLPRITLFLEKCALTGKKFLLDSLKKKRIALKF